MLLVLVMGAAVTNTGSAEGCGRSWPLCNGQFLPEFTVGTAIEYSHRAVTGLEGLLVVGLTVAMLTLWRRQREVTVLALLMLGTLLLQAGLGAGAVLWPQSPLMLATHFGVSLVAFASTFLSAVVVYERTGGAQGKHVEPPVPGRFRNFALGVGAYVLVVVYLGAYVRHAGVSLACVDWPLCNGQLVPALDGPSAVVFAHRVAALGAVVLLGALALTARSTRRMAVGAFGLGILQALSGAIVVWSRLGLFSTLLHAALMGLLFAALASIVLQTLRHRERNDSVAFVHTLSDATARGLQQPESASIPHALVATASALSGADERRTVADDGRGERTVPGTAQRAPGAE